MNTEFDYDMAIRQLRETRPAAARILEESCELAESTEPCWELVIALALTAAQTEEAVVSANASLDGLCTQMAARMQDDGQ